MASISDFVDTRSWPGVNTHAFWSLSERVDDIFALESSEETRAEYVFQNDVDGKLLKAPFDGLYNLYVDSWANVVIEKATLYLNDKALEVVDGPEINFDTFTEKNPLPLTLMGNDELRIVLRFGGPAYVPKTLGSARLMRFTWKDKNQAFVVATNCHCAIMYDGHQLRAVSYIEDDESDDEGLKNLLKEITGPNPNKELFEQAMKQM